MRGRRREELEYLIRNIKVLSSRYGYGPTKALVAIFKK